MEQQIQLTGIITYDGVTDGYTAECPQLGILSAGRTVEEAKDAILDAVDGFLQICSERGTLDKVLRDRRVVLDQPPMMFPTPTNHVSHAISNQLQPA